MTTVPVVDRASTFRLPDVAVTTAPTSTVTVNVAWKVLSIAPVTPKMDTPFLMLTEVRLASPFIVCVPPKYWPAAIVWSDVPGV